MNDQQRAAMQMALNVMSKWTEPRFEEAITALREAGAQHDIDLINRECRYTTPLMDEEAQPQGEWVDLTIPELEAATSGNLAHVLSVHAAIAKFKEKNTPPVVPQGEPVACPYPCGWDDLYSIIVKNGAYLVKSLDSDNFTEAQWTCLTATIQHAKKLAEFGCRLRNTTSPSSQLADAAVEAAIKAERDRFAEEARPTINRAERRGYELAKEKAAKVCKPFGNTGEVIAAAIRGMK